MGKDKFEGVNEINKYQLDIAAVDQPRLYEEVCKEIAEVLKEKMELDVEIKEMEKEFKRRKAVKEIEIRALSVAEMKDIYHVEKVTESTIAAAVTGNALLIEYEKEIYEKKKKLIEVEYIYEKLEGKRSALRQKKDMIAILWEMHKSQYFADIEVKEVDEELNKSFK